MGKPSADHILRLQFHDVIVGLVIYRLQVSGHWYSDVTCPCSFCLWQAKSVVVVVVIAVYVSGIWFSSIVVETFL